MNFRAGAETPTDVNNNIKYTVHRLVAPKVKGLQTEFHQCYISILWRDMTVYLSCPIPILQVMSRVTPEGKTLLSNCFLEELKTKWTNDLKLMSLWLHHLLILTRKRICFKAPSFFSFFFFGNNVVSLFTTAEIGSVHSENLLISNLSLAKMSGQNVLCIFDGEVLAQRGLQKLQRRCSYICFCSFINTIHQIDNKQ